MERKANRKNKEEENEEGDIEKLIGKPTEGKNNVKMKDINSEEEGKK